MTSRTCARTALVVAAAGALLTACGYPNPNPDTGPVATTTGAPSPSATPNPGGDSFTAGAGLRANEFADGLRSIDLTTGTGATAKAGDSVTVQYTGWLATGQEFDSSWGRGQPFTFTIGKTAVIKGWTEGVPGMKVGGKRQLTIPSSLGYGAAGQPPTIPPDSTLVFEITLLAVGPGH